MMDNVLMANEVVDYARRNTKSLFHFKVDFEKAFDLVSWCYLTFILKKMNFDNTLIKWIQACFFSRSFSILVNGSPMLDF